MNNDEIIKGAVELAQDAVVLLSASLQVKDPALKAELLGKAFSGLKVASEEASRVRRDVKQRAESQ